jgi:hypothetical protein
MAKRKVRPRMTEEEWELWDKIKDNEFIQENINVLSAECEKAGIPLNDVKHYWYKSKHISVFAKNKVVSYEEVKDKLIAEMQQYSPVYPKIERIEKDDGHLLVIDPSDIHVGKLAVAAESGEDYNIEIAVRRTIEGVFELLSHASGFDIDQVVFIIGNDALHVDNPKRTTTSGTPQDTDGQWFEAFYAAKEMYVKCIELLMQIADVHVLYCPSNHDYSSGFFLADVLNSWFRQSPNVTFDTKITHRKYYQYHENMIEADHGDGCKLQDTPMLMATEQPKMWSDTKFRYSYKHHIHHHVGKDLIGVNVTSLRSPSAPDRWHSTNGYINMPAVEGFIHAKTKGRIAHFTHYF